MLGLILQWRPNVTTLITAVLSTLKCLYKIGQSSSCHLATICISVLCPVPSLRSVTTEDSCNIPSCFHMAFHGIYSCQHHCDVVWTDTTDLLICCIYLYCFLYCAAVTSPSLQCLLTFPKHEWSQVWTAQGMQNSHTTTAKPQCNTNTHRTRAIQPMK